MSVGLFKKIAFLGAAGTALEWRIECDVFDQEDWNEIASICAPHLDPFNKVIGVPTGGLVVARAFEPYVNETGKVGLIVDDVWTSGSSMMFHVPLHGRWIGFVGFSRGYILPWVTAFMQCGPKFCIDWNAPIAWSKEWNNE